MRGRNTTPCVELFGHRSRLAWLLEHSQSEWVDRYGVRLEDSRLPSGEEERQTWVQSVGRDGASLLSALFEPGTPSWLAQVPAVEILRRVWIQNYQWSEGKLAWRSSENIPPASLYISSPYESSCPLQ